MENGSDHPHSPLRVPHSAFVELSVKDTGIGVPPEMRGRIFEMFAQIDRRMETGYPGLGIGLTLARRLVEMHGGTIEVQSEGPNRGSEFIVRLPIAAELPHGAPGAVAAEEDGAPLPAARRVLVVDDNAEAAEMLRMAVAMLGGEVCTAGDGRQALEVAAEFLPDVVLMDLGMPTMDGYEAARRMRQQPWGKNLTLIALTGWGQDEDRQRTKEAGFDHHLVKPAEPAELRRLLGAHSVPASDCAQSPLG